MAPTMWTLQVPVQQQQPVVAVPAVQSALPNAPAAVAIPMAILAQSVAAMTVPFCTTGGPLQAVPMQGALMLPMAPVMAQPVPKVVVAAGIQPG